MARTKTYLQKTMTSKEIDQLAKRVSNSYATSDLEFSVSYYTEKEDITKKCFYWLLELAIVRNLVPDKTVMMMREKSDTNINRKSMEYTMQGNARSQLRYARMIGERKWFIFLEGIPKEKKIEITTYFAEHPELTREEIGERFGIPRGKTIAMDKIIEDTLLQNLVDDEIFTKIRLRSLGPNPNPSKEAINYFGRLKRRRNKNKKTAS